MMGYRPVGSLSLGVIAHGTELTSAAVWAFCERFQRNGSLLVEGRGEAGAVVSKHRPAGLLVVIPTRLIAC